MGHMGQVGRVSRWEIQWGTGAEVMGREHDTWGMGRRREGGREGKDGGKELEEEVGKE